MSSKWTPERIAALKQSAEANELAGFALPCALDEIESLQARVEELEERLQGGAIRMTTDRYEELVKAEKRVQRCEQLLRKCLEFAELVEDTADRVFLPPAARTIAAAILAELEGGR